MNLASYIIGTHLWFFREGDAFTLPDPGGTCGQEVKPGIAPDLDPVWIDLGAVESFEPTVAQTDYELWKPAPGRLVLKDLLENKQKLTIKAVTNDVGGLAVEAMFRATQELANTTGTEQQFNPLSAISRRGWIHAQFYDQDNNNYMNLDLWSRLRATGKFMGEPTKPEWEMFMLYSSLNTGSIY